MNRLTHLGIVVAATMLMAVTTAVHAASVTLDDVEARRVLDTNSDGSGDTPQESALDVGRYSNATDSTNPVFVFQMTGVSNPANITSADFTVTQAVAIGTIEFDVQAHAIRTAATSTILASDYEDSDQLLMSNFDNGNTNGSVSLDPAAETTLGAWLAANWSAGDYVFIGLKSDPVVTGGATRLLRYGNSGGGWTAESTDSQLSVTVVPIPAALPAGLGLLALTTLRRKRRA